MYLLSSSVLTMIAALVVPPPFIVDEKTVMLYSVNSFRSPKVMLVVGAMTVLVRSGPDGNVW